LLQAVPTTHVLRLRQELDRMSAENQILRDALVEAMNAAYDSDGGCCGCARARGRGHADGCFLLPSLEALTKAMIAGRVLHEARAGRLNWDA